MNHPSRPILTTGVVLLIVLAAVGGAGILKFGWRDSASAPSSAETAPEASVASPEASPNEFVAIVGKVSRIPDPAASEYANCAAKIIVTLESGEERLCLAPAFQERQMQPYGRLAVGDRVRMRVRESHQIPREIISIYRVADDTNSLETEWWVDQLENLGSRSEPTPTLVSHEDLETRYSEESVSIRSALFMDPSSLLKGQHDFFLYGDRHFYRDDFWKEPPEGPESAGIRDCLLQFHQFLESRNIEMYLALIPVGTSIFPDLAVNHYFDPAHHTPPNEPIREMLRDLSQHGVRSVDLTPLMLANRWSEVDGVRYPVVRPNDSHWSPLGAKLASAEIARIVRDRTQQSDCLDLVSPDSFRVDFGLMEFESDISDVLRRKYPHWNVNVEPHQTPSCQVLASGAAAPW